MLQIPWEKKMYINKILDWHTERGRGHSQKILTLFWKITVFLVFVMYHGNVRVSHHMPPLPLEILFKKSSPNSEYDNNSMKNELYHDTELLTLKTWNMFLYILEKTYLFYWICSYYPKDHIQKTMWLLGWLCDFEATLKKSWLLNITSWIFVLLVKIDTNISDSILVWWKNLLEISCHQKV